MTIIDALSDDRLLGGLPAFADLSTWSSWLTFLKAAYGLPLDAGELETYREHTGRTVYAPPAGGFPEVVAVVARQSGKTRIAATIAAFEAVRAAPSNDERFALLVSQDQRASLRTLLSYARAPFESVDSLRHSVTSSLAGSVSLENHVTIVAYPCRPASVRGLRAQVVVLDELAFFTGTEGRPSDVEMLRAVRPCLATTGGKLIVLSSPYSQSGALYDLHRRHFGRDDSTTLVWQASAPAMNPTLPLDYLARMEADDPEAYRSEVLGEFRAGVSTLLDPDSVAACVETGARERPPADGVPYVSFVDAASGSGKDSFTLAVAHLDGERAVLDVCRAWRPPFNPSGVIAEVADVLKAYGLTETNGDRYAPGFVSEAFRSQGVTYTASERDRSAIYIELLPLINSASVVLLDDAKLLSELHGLERRRGASGRDKVDHRSGSHDDRANAAAGALVLVAQGAGKVCPNCGQPWSVCQNYHFWGGGDPVGPGETFEDAVIRRGSRGWFPGD